MQILLDSDKRVVATCQIGGFGGGIDVDELPPSDYYNYIYQNGQYIYSQKPKQQIKEQKQIQSESLEEKINKLQKQNEELLECVLQMSEIIYA